MNQNNLQHTGVMGMKWGKRKASYSQMKDSFYKHQNQIEKTDKNAKALRKTADSLHKERVNGQAGQMKWQKANHEAMKYVSNKAAEKLVEEYGKKNYNSFVTKNNVRNGVAVASILSIVGSPIGFVLAVNSVNGESKTGLTKK